MSNLQGEIGEALGQLAAEHYNITIILKELGNVHHVPSTDVEMQRRMRGLWLFLTRTERKEWWTAQKIKGMFKRLKANSKDLGDFSEQLEVHLHLIEALEGKLLAALDDDTLRSDFEAITNISQVNEAIKRNPEAYWKLLRKIQTELQELDLIIIGAEVEFRKLSTLCQQPLQNIIDQTIELCSSVNQVKGVVEVIRYLEQLLGEKISYHNVSAKLLQLRDYDLIEKQQSYPQRAGKSIQEYQMKLLQAFDIDEFERCVNVLGLFLDRKLTQAWIEERVSKLGYDPRARDEAVVRFIAQYARRLGIPLSARKEIYGKIMALPLYARFREILSKI